jgi:hypothetical protein
MGAGTVAGCGNHDRQRRRCCHAQSSRARQHVPLSFDFHDVSRLAYDAAAATSIRTG